MFQFLILTLFIAFALSLAEITLLDFSGDYNHTTSKFWKLTNDPVMGGLSYSTWTTTVTNGTVIGSGIWDGKVEIVPSLNAPGFCNVMSQTKQWPDAEGYNTLVITARSTVPYKGFKVSFAADTLNKQFKCFKSDFIMQSTGDWEEISVPFNTFSNDWSSYTGEPITTCASNPSVCPTEKNLKDISQIGFWMEGVEGEFHFEVQKVSAVKR